MHQWWANLAAVVDASNKCGHIWIGLVSYPSWSELRLHFFSSRYPLKPETLYLAAVLSISFWINISRGHVVFFSPKLDQYLSAMKTTFVALEKSRAKSVWKTRTWMMKNDTWGWCRRKKIINQDLCATVFNSNLPPLYIKKLKRGKTLGVFSSFVPFVF